MGDWSLWIADIEAGSGEAPGLAGKVLGWLVEQEIVRAEITDCVLGDTVGGHAPGDRFASAVREPYEGFLDRWPNGLEVDIGRVAYFGAVDEDDRVTCPRCGAWMPLGVLLPEVEEWEDGGPDSLACPGCAGRTALNDWGWPVPCAFTALGFQFWNWPPLTAEFLAALADRLGHRTIVGQSGVGISY